VTIAFRIFAPHPMCASGSTIGDSDMLAYSQGSAGASLEVLVLKTMRSAEYAYRAEGEHPLKPTGGFPALLYQAAMT
jgi:hypothetical protein